MALEPADADEIREVIRAEIRRAPPQRDSGVLVGTGTPNGQITASVGAIYRRLDGGAGTTFWVKESGANTSSGWVAK
jgi:hypothetical protein